MIAFGSSIQGAEAFRRYAEPGISLAAEPDSEIYAYAAVEPLGRTYNLILDAAGTREDLEALVLVHPHVEICDSSFSRKVREALRQPEAAVVGCAGATGVKSIAWWEGTVTAAPLKQRYNEFGGGEVPAYAWTRRKRLPAEVEVVDGQLLALSPWAVRNLRFDETLVLNYGFDLDLCLQARAAGRRILVADLRAIYHRSLELVGDLEVWVEAHIRLAEKWDHTLHGPVADDLAWKRRARLAEADREAARAIAFSKSLKLDARVLELERELEQKTNSASWRMTAPLRSINRLRRNLAAPNRRPVPGGSPPSRPPTAPAPPPPGPSGATNAPRPRTRSTQAVAEAAPPGVPIAPEGSRVRPDGRGSRQDDGRVRPRVARGSGSDPTGRESG